MNYLLKDLRQDTFNAIFEVARKAWVPTILAYFITAIVSMLGVYYMFNMLGFTSEDLAQMQSFGFDFEAAEAFVESKREMIMQNVRPSFLLSYLLFLVVIFFFSAWLYNVAYISIHQVLKEEKPSIIGVFSQSFNGNIVRLAGAFFLLMIFLFVLFTVVSLLIGLVAASSASIGMLAMIGGMFLIGVIMMRFAPALPSIVYEDIPVGKALMESFNSISYSKAAKYTAIAMVTAFLLMIIAFILALVSGVVANIPVIGSMLGQFLSLVLYGITATIFCAATVALYFKYIATEAESENDSLQKSNF